MFQFSIPKLPIRTAILTLITFQSAQGLYETDIPRLLAGTPDIFGTVFDAGFLVYGTKTILGQIGLANKEPAASLADLEATVTLDAGREDGTWMPAEWGASGARLSLPLALKFTDEQIDLGFPGEESFGGRFGKKIVAQSGSFVGTQGQVAVQPEGGAWTVLPTGRDGETRVRFFLDFPEEITRNDVVVPAGRVYFSMGCFDGAAANALQVPSSEVMAGPNGMSLVSKGGMTIVKNGIKNGYGAFGDANFILGRFTIAPPPRDTSIPETPQEKAARERAEDAARGRF